MDLVLVLNNLCEIFFVEMDWFCINVVINIEDVTKTYVTWRFEVLHLGDW